MYTPSPPVPSHRPSLLENATALTQELWLLNFLILILAVRNMYHMAKHGHTLHRQIPCHRSVPALLLSAFAA